MGPALLCFLLTGLFLTACGERPAPVDNTASTGKTDKVLARSTVIKADDSRLQSVEIKTEQVLVKDLPVMLQLDGQIEPDTGKEVDVSTRILGRAIKVYVNPGESVTAGQLLAVLDSKEISELEAELIEAKSKLRIVQAQKEREAQILHEQVMRPTALIDATEKYHDIEAQKELADSEFERQEGLLREKIASQKDYLAAKANRARLRARWEAASLELQREQHLYSNQALMRKDFQLAEAEEARAERHLDTLKQRLTFLGMHPNTVADVLKTNQISGELHILAPGNGVITHQDVAAGEVVHTEHPMFIITNLTNVLVKAELPEEDLTRVRLNDVVRVTCLSYPDQVFNGTVNYISEHVNPTKHSLTVSARLANGEHKLKANMSAKILLTGPSREFLACPKAAIAEHGQSTFVFVRTEDGYRRQQIQIGSESTEYFEVTGGLSEGQSVVTKGKAELLALLESRH
jgi:cobalt-zinc-cadmium efflux system membrane fusion protein